MKNVPRLNFYLATIAVVLLLPAILYLADNWIGGYQIYKAVMNSDPSEKNEMVRFSIEFILFAQLYSLSALTPGILLCSFVVFKRKYFSKWFVWSLIALSISMLITFPVISIAGIYLYWLAMKLKRNA